MCASIIDKYLNQKDIYEYLSLGKFASYYNKLSKYHQKNFIRFVNYNKYKDIEIWLR